MNTKGGLTRTHNQMQEMQQKDTETVECLV